MFYSKHEKEKKLLIVFFSLFSSTLNGGVKSFPSFDNKT